MIDKLQKRIDQIPQKKISTEEKEEDSDTFKKIDIVFCVDCTASMGSYIKAAQENVVKIVQDLICSEKADLRFALISYRDHPPQDSTYVTKKFEFTQSFQQMQTNVATMSAQGGGDGPEAVTAALHEALNLDYRDDATKFCILIADAPPHGLGVSGDGFPDGDPDGKDPIEIAHAMLKSGITLYVAACEPSVSNYENAADFFIGIAKITEGKCLPLTSANLLAKVIIGGAAEEASLDEVMAKVEEEAKRLQEERKRNNLVALDDASLELEVCKNLQKDGVTTKYCEVDDVGYAQMDMHNVEAIYTATSLSAAKAEWKTKSAPVVAVPSSSATPQTSRMYKGLIDTSHVSRVMKKSAARKGKVW
jgi:Mg-chelatase subunit ChlD